MKLIIESPILQEVKMLKKDNNKAIWHQTMQYCNEINQNKRMYPRQILESGMTSCSERIKRRSFWGELDHPLMTGDNVVDMHRQSQVLLKEVSHLLRGYEFQGNRLVGELETISTPNGKILLGLLGDTCSIGLSLRGLASLKRSGEYNEVEGPMTVVSYDAVSAPSHKSAVVDFNEMKFESKTLLESMGVGVYKDINNKNKGLNNGNIDVVSRDLITESECGDLVCINGICYLSEYFDKLIEAKSIRFFQRWV